MDFRLIRRLIRDKVRDRATYGVAAVVGILISLYGQLLVPWFRGADSAVDAFLGELDERPALTAFSIVLAFAFPFCVGVYSSVATRYKNRRLKSVADFPDRKPDPVFRAAANGRMVEAGAETRVWCERLGITRAQDILGEEVWADIASAGRPGTGRRV